MQALVDNIVAIQRSGRNVVVIPHSEGNMITRGALRMMDSTGTWRTNGDRTCLAIAPMASMTTTYPPVASKYVKPTQLEGDIVTLLPDLEPRGETFPTQEHHIGNLISIRELGFPITTQALALLNGVTIHQMDSYMATAGGQAYVIQAATDAYTACAVAPFEVIAGVGSPMLVGTTAQFSVIAHNGADDLITNRPPTWSAGGGLRIDSGGSATATGRDATGTNLNGGVSATIGVMEAGVGFSLYTTPPRIKTVTCTKGETWYEVTTQYTRWKVHGEAESTVGPYAKIEYIIFELELKQGGRPNRWYPITGTGPNDAEEVWTLFTPYYEGPTSDTALQPTGNCRITAYDTFGKFAQSSP